MRVDAPYLSNVFENLPPVWAGAGTSSPWKGEVRLSRSEVGVGVRRGPRSGRIGPPHQIAPSAPSLTPCARFGLRPRVLDLPLSGGGGAKAVSGMTSWGIDRRAGAARCVGLRIPRPPAFARASARQARRRGTRGDGAPHESDAFGAFFTADGGRGGRCLRLTFWMLYPRVPRRGAGVVDRDGLENRCTFTGTVSSNLTLSARPPCPTRRD